MIQTRPPQNRGRYPFDLVEPPPEGAPHHPFDLVAMGQGVAPTKRGELYEPMMERVERIQMESGETPRAWHEKAFGWVADKPLQE